MTRRYNSGKEVQYGKTLIKYWQIDTIVRQRYLNGREVNAIKKKVQ